MMENETPLDRALNQVWNDLVSDDRPLERPDAPSVLPPDLAETVHRLHVMSRAPLPPAAHHQLARRQVRWQALGRDGLAGTGLTSRPAGRPAALRQRPRRPDAVAPDAGRVGAAPPASGGRSQGRAVTIPTVVLLVCVALVAIGLVRREQVGVRTHTAIFQLTLPAGTLPASDRVSGRFTYFTVAPGGVGDWTSDNGTCCPGVRLDYVLTGELTVQSGAPAQVFRAGQREVAERIPAGREVVVTPGDVVLTRYDATMTSRNTGMTPIGLLDLAVIDGFSPLVAEPPGWLFHPDGYEVYGIAMPDQGIALRLDAITLGAGQSHPLPAGTITQFGVTLIDGLPLHGDQADAITNPSAEAVTVHVITLAPAPVPR